MIGRADRDAHAVLALLSGVQGASRCKALAADGGMHELLFHHAKWYACGSRGHTLSPFSRRISYACDATLSLPLRSALIWGRKPRNLRCSRRSRLRIRSNGNVVFRAGPGKES